MKAQQGDELLQHGRVVGQRDHVGKIVEVLGTGGEPPYRVKFEDGHEGVVSPGPDSVVRHPAPGVGTPTTG
ncbi:MULTISPECIES: DUF1918 domain-containing protein [Streptomycetaceae]|uniref:DUF1918 domain-containing protein n=1 Tax=Streptantibioticus cattleyicolor (strain ATCC 35852 / DSM 46488 / JCM 4925 / NBRC 14057 / NRRL 8057) TaxID=1003195 RepID=F8K2R5_STREN|nr:MULTISPECIES: DUF1918 domain-containing protein [Streptomycetaceae]AEW97579.1 hypothetical protein SCATT_52080 [Streptantibioticus cattleyicolor NRRL 8057 = DSM 46488]MYS62011.1 DUF1918 domain-containing protein [Streptomyces sp. SID5468]CCB77904.1 conserved protein of unknown function [Streptantibioticus cattleyicolor NRRL 8057 = DSM 46488]